VGKFPAYSSFSQKGARMIASKKSKIFYFCLFLFPAFILYSLFFIIPLFQGIQYSFTDWNGIVPEIPFNMNKIEFENKVIKKLHQQNDIDCIRRYYVLDTAGGNYSLTNWIKEGKETRQITTGEKLKLKKILKKAGITSINFIGLKNYQDMFLHDERFVPRIEKKYLFNEFDDLPKAITAKAFHKNLLNHISLKKDQDFVLAFYKYDQKKSHYVLDKSISDNDSEKLKTLISENMYKSALIPGVIGFTLFFVFFNVIFSNLLAFILALILDTKMKTRNALRSIFFLPNVLSLIIVAFIWSFVFRLILPAITGISVWLGSPDLAPYAVLMVTIWQGCGYLMIIYLAGLQTIPMDILEVTQIDGAKWHQRLFRVTIPLLMPAITICLFYSLSNSFKCFDVILALTSGGPGYVTTPIVLDIYFNAFNNNQFGYATAKAVLLCLVIMFITGVQLYLMKKKEVEL
jgi:raffinose/stachyose/melibiose transport system permease protein